MLTAATPSRRPHRLPLLLKPLAGAVLLALSPLVWAAGGKIIFATGEVQLSRNGAALQSLARGSELQAGDLVITGAQGFAQMLMDDGGRVTLRANSQLRLDQYAYDASNGSNNRSLMSLLSGSMRAITGLIGRNNREHYSIRTPTATVGIRGSDGNVGFDPAIGASVQTLEGGHTLTSVDAQGVAHTLILNPGDVGLVPPGGGPPQRVQNFPFATTLAPQARPQRTASSGSESRPAPAGSARPGSTPTVSASATTPLSATLEPVLVNVAPSLFDGEGRLPAVDADGDPVIVTPGGNTPPQLGLSPRLSGVLSASSWTIGLLGQYSQHEVDSQLLRTEQIQYDGSGHLLGWTQGDSSLFSDYTSFAGGTAEGHVVSGDLRMGAWRPAADAGMLLTTGYLENNGGRQTAWAIGDAGYYQLDVNNPMAMPLSGTMNYSGSAIGGRSHDGSTVTLNSASLQADFNLQQAGLQLDVSAGATRWQANASGLSLMSMSQQPYRNSFQAVSSPTGGNLSLVNSSAGSTPVWGSVTGSFTGANFSGALLRYDFYQADGGDKNLQPGVSGGVAFVADGPVNGPSVTTPPTQMDQVAVTDAGFAQGGSLLVTGLDGSSPRGWEWGAYFDPTQRSGIRLVGGTISENAVMSNGLRSGSWVDGQLEHYFERTLEGNSSAHWATLLQPQAWYLPAVLSGTASYEVSHASGPLASDGSAWTLNAAESGIVVDFTLQNVEACVSLSDSQGKVLKAITTDAPLNPGSGQFFAGSSQASASGEGSLQISYDGQALTTSQAWGRLAGQLGGNGLSQAMLGYGLTLTPPCNALVGCESNASLVGLIGLSGAQQDENQPFVAATLAVSAGGQSLTTLGLSSLDKFSEDASGVSGLDAWPDFNRAVHLARDNASVAEQGQDAATGLAWGRWSGTALIKDAGRTQVLGEADNVHYVYSRESGPAQLPLSGVYSYAPVGHSTPTNQAGALGTLDSATLVADFNTRQVAFAVKASVDGTTLSASASQVSLFDNAFHATHLGGGTGQLQVSCSGSCGSQHQGSVSGQLTGNGGIGAGLSYSLGTSGADTTQLPATQIHGVVAFKRGP